MSCYLNVIFTPCRGDSRNIWNTALLVHILHIYLIPPHYIFILRRYNLVQNPDVHPDVHHDHHHTLEFSENTNNQKLISLFTSSPGTRHFYSFTFDTCLLKTFDIFWLCFEKSNPVEKYRTDRPTVFFCFFFSEKYALLYAYFLYR